MALVDIITFVVLKIINNFRFMQRFLFTNNCSHKQNFEHNITFIFSVFSETVNSLVPGVH